MQPFQLLAMQNQLQTTMEVHCHQNNHHVCYLSQECGECAGDYALDELLGNVSYYHHT